MTITPQTGTVVPVAFLAAWPGRQRPLSVHLVPVDIGNDSPSLDTGRPWAAAL